MAITWNDVHADLAVSGLQVYNNAVSGYRGAIASAPISGKCVFGFLIEDGPDGSFHAFQAGLCESTEDVAALVFNPGILFNHNPEYEDDGSFVDEWSPGAYDGVVLLIAVDPATGKYWYATGDAGTAVSWNGDPAAGTGEAGTIATENTLFPAVALPSENDGGAVITGLFTQSDIDAAVSGTYTHPSGFGDIPDTVILETLQLTQTVATPLSVETLQLSQRVAIPLPVELLQLQQYVVLPTAALLELVQTVAVLQAVETLQLAQAVELPAEATLQLPQIVATPLAVEVLSLVQYVADQSLQPADVVDWTDRVLLNGVDISAQVTGVNTIDEERGGAVVADVTIRPTAGAVVDITAYINAMLEIWYGVRDLAGNVVGEWLQFRGRVHVPEIDDAAALIRLRCTDQYQERINRMSRAQIDALTPGALWSPHVFGDEAQGWTYLQQRMSTIPASLDLTADGFFRFTSWAAASADYTLTENDWIDGTPRFEIAHRAKIHNRVTLKLQYRFTRQHQRKRQIGWGYDRTLCEWVVAPTTIPTKDMAQRAVEGLGWLIEKLTFVPFWQSGRYTCVGREVSIINRSPDLIIGTSATLKRRWTQVLTAEWTVNIEAPASIAAYGLRERSEVESMETEFDAAAWEGPEGDNRKASGFRTVFGATDGANNSIGSNLGSSEQYPPPDGATQNEWGDHILDNIDASGFDTFARTAISRAVTGILADHEQNICEIDIPLHPLIHRGTALEINGGGKTALGRVMQIVKRLNREEGDGSARMLVKIAVSRGGGAATPSEIVAPAIPAYTPAPPASFGTFLGSGAATQIGGREDSPEFKEERPGYSGNYSAASVSVIGSELSDDGRNYRVDGIYNNSLPENARVYPERLKFNLDEVDAALRDPVTLPASVTVTVAPPHNTLSYTQPSES